MKVPLLDLKSEYQAIKADIDRAITEVLESGHFILGGNVKQFEEEVARFCQVSYGVGVSSGTDALVLALLACGLKEDDEVITTPSTFIATAEAISQVGAQVVFADIDLETYCIAPEEIEKKITAKTKAIIPVHLYGHPCDMDAIMSIAKEHNLMVIEDCAQAIGAEHRGRRVGSFGVAGCFSFFPSKNLGAYGDGGMVVTNSEGIAQKVRMLRAHGGRDKYHHCLRGYNSRLDEIQAAILRVKMKHLNEWNGLRRSHAALMRETLCQRKVDRYIVLPREAEGVKHVYHIYAIRTKNRDELGKFLQQQRITTAIHYPVPLHLEDVYQDMGWRKGSYPHSEILADETLSLPLYPYIKDEQINYIADNIAKFHGVA